MASSVEKLLSNLAEHAEWCDTNEWEIPITMGDDIREAISTIQHLSNQPLTGWEFAGYEMHNTEYPEVIWRCKRCGYKRLAGWMPPYYQCPECTGRDNTDKKGETKR